MESVCVLSFIILLFAVEEDDHRVVAEALEEEDEVEECEVVGKSSSSHTDMKAGVICTCFFIFLSLFYALQNGQLLSS